MPIVPYESVLGSRGATLGQFADVSDPEGPAALDLAEAAFRQNNIAAGGYDPGLPGQVGIEKSITGAISRFAADLGDAEEDFDPLTDDNLSGYEQFADRFIGSASSKESSRIKFRIDAERKDQELIARAGGAGLAASIAAGIVDPITLASMLVPAAGAAGASSRGARILSSVGRTAALDAGQEAFLQNQQELRTAGQSIINIGAGTLLSGAFGALATRVPKKEFDATIAAAKAHTAGLNEGVESTAGAARAGFGTTLDDETVAKGGEALLKTMGKINPLARVMQASSKRARILMQELADVPFLLKKHLKGVESPQSAEGAIKVAQADVYRLIKETDAGWKAHKASGGAMKRDEFSEAVASALRRGDESADPAVAKAAQQYRRYFDQSLADLKKSGLLPEDTVAKFSKSYLPRVYDHQKIRANRMGLEETLRDWFGRQSDVLPEEVNAAVADVIDTINGNFRQHAQIEPGFVGTKGALKERTLAVPDEVLEPWLINNVEKIFEGYVRTVQPQLVLKKKFGDLDMRQQMQDVRDEYVAMREKASSNEAKAKIDDEMKATLDDIQAVRDLHLGKFGTPANPDSFLVRAGRVARTWNYARSLGGQLMSSFPDAGRVMARHGLVKTGKMIARLVSDSGLRNLSKEQAHKVGTALEYVLNTRADTLGDIGNEMLGSRIDRFLRRESNRFSRLTGMASWNSALKTLAVALEQDAIVAAAKGGKLSKFQKGQLANLGMGERMLERVRKQITDHAVDIDGLFRANAETWTDTEAARAFEQALLKSADQVVLTKGVADTPLFMAKEIGKTLLQFKSFGMASVNRMLIPMSQGVAHGDLATVNGGIMMLAIGAMANAARDWAAGFTPQTDPARVAVEAFDRAGFTGFMAEPYDAMAKMTGLPSIGRFKSTSLAEQILGPAIGGAIDAAITTEKVLTESGEFDPQVSASDVYRFRKLIPYQNLFYLRRLINAMEGEFSEEIGADGSSSKSFTERLTESKTLNTN